MKEVLYEFIPEGPMPTTEGARGLGAIEFLTKEHREVQSLLRQVVQAKEGNKKSQLVQKICLELIVHSLMEEELVYPLLMEADEKEAIEAATEHSLVKFMIGDIENTQAGVFCDAKIKVLSELVNEHIKEEEATFLPALKKAGIVDMQVLGQALRKRKQELMKNSERLLAEAKGGASSAKTSKVGSTNRKSARAGKRSTSRNSSSKRSASRLRAGGGRKKK